MNTVEPALPRHRKRPGIRIHRSTLLILLIGLISGVSFVVLCFIPQHGVNVARDKAPINGLPQDARNVSYHIVPAWPSHWYEFDTSPLGFDQWVAQNPDLSGPKLGRVEIYAIEDYGAGISPRRLEIEDGILYKWSHRDMGQYRAYDRATGRAYFYAHTR